MLRRSGSGGTPHHWNETNRMDPFRADPFPIPSLLSSRSATTFSVASGVPMTRRRAMARNCQHPFVSQGELFRVCEAYIVKHIYIIACHIKAARPSRFVSLGQSALPFTRRSEHGGNGGE